MNSPVMPARRWAAFLALPVLLGLAGCRVEMGKLGLPTPTPSPTPTPLVEAALETFSSAAVSEPSLSARVAVAGADYLTQTTASAAEQTTSVRRALSRAAKTPGEITASLLEAKKFLSAARDAYGKAEASVFLVDPDSADELRAQPDPLGAGSPAGRALLMSDLVSSIDAMEEILSRPLDSSAAGTLLSEARATEAKIEKLESGMCGLAAAWKGGEADNFRGKFFLPSSETAVARMFQGLLAMTGDVLPGLLAARGYDPAEVCSRLVAVREIYTGSIDAPEGDPSLCLLVQQASPVQAALTRASIARAAALAGVLAISPDSEKVRAQLASSLDDVTRQLTFAAGCLGIVVVAQDGS
ncbi:MAG: hypothetical protein JHD33_01755 [Chthoniobacterales bacterium]|nr:hypothetical protein [Chthoniobacterales bacterium]